MDAWKERDGGQCTSQQKQWIQKEFFFKKGTVALSRPGFTGRDTARVIWQSEKPAERQWKAFGRSLGK